ncbi:hypothetical protein Taro_043822 [Colocasia esculenta]|uniref:Uncharacterized protein n=1 Tax=Colocasia esculenta TaxID=4460 RepID=A0A843WZL4_COLES|nr:hypothetical protein [Colocasia esculenta]
MNPPEKPVPIKLRHNVGRRDTDWRIDRQKRDRGGRACTGQCFFLSEVSISHHSMKDMAILVVSHLLGRDDDFVYIKDLLNLLVAP